MDKGGRAANGVSAPRRRFAGSVISTALIAALLASVALATHPGQAKATSTTLVATATSYLKPVISPHGTWQALSLTTSSGPTVLRSSDGTNWASIGAPTSTIVSIAVNDSGEVYAVAPTPGYSGGGPTNFYRYTTAWSAAAVYDSGYTGNGEAPTAVVTSGSTLVGFSNTGHAFYSTNDGTTWTQGGNVCCGGSYSVIGNEVHIVETANTTVEYASWSMTTKTAAAGSILFPVPAVTTPSAEVFSTTGSTTQLLMVIQGRGDLGPGGGLFIFHSADAGASWAEVVSNDLYPSNLPRQYNGIGPVPGWFSIGADNRLHVFSTTTSPTGVTIYEASRGVGPTPDWSPTTTLATVLSTTSSVTPGGWAPQRADGVQPDAATTWASVPSASNNSQADIYLLRGSGTPIAVTPPTTTTVSPPLIDSTSGNGAVTSPTGTWRARLTVSGIARSADGIHWENIGQPSLSPGESLASLAVNDAGEAYLVSSFVPPGSTYCYYCQAALWRSGAAGAWFGPVIYDYGETDLFAHPVAIATDDTTLVGISSSGRVWFSTDDGNNWQDGGSGAGGAGPAAVIGNEVHTIGVGSSGYTWYGRWNSRTRAADPVTTQPAVPQWEQPTLFSANDSTTDLWIESTRQGVNGGGASYSLFHSTDAGANWSTVVIDETPSTLPSSSSIAFSMGSDDRLHGYTATWASGTTTVWEANRGLASAPDWTIAQPVLTATTPSGGTPSGTTTQQANGVQPGVINMWFAAANASSGSSAYWVTRGGPPLGGALTAGETYSGTNLAELCWRCLVPDVTYYPVTPSTGNFWHDFDDLTIPGRGPALHFGHSYNSMAASVNGPLGYGWTEPYNMRLEIGTGSNPVTVDQEDGAQVAFALAGTSYTAPPRVQAALAHNADGTWTFTRRAREIFSFDASGRLTAERDLNGSTTTVAYPNSTTTVVTDPEGRTLTLALDGAGRVTTVTDTASPARTVRFSYDAVGNLSSVTDVGGGVTRFTYDSSHRLLTMVDPNQANSLNPSPVTNHYDAQGRLDWQSDFLGRKTSFDYTSVPGSTIVTDPKNDATLFTFNYGLLTSETKGYGTSQAATWTYSYDPVTLGVTTIADPNGGVSTRSYDSQGNVTTTSDQLRRSTKATYNSLDEPLTTTDGDGVTTTFQYDAAGNLTSQSTPWIEGPPNAASTVSYHHDNAAHPGDVTSVTDPTSKTTVLGYDSSGDLANSSDALGNETQWCWDNVGRPTASIQPSGHAAGATWPRPPQPRSRPTPRPMRLATCSRRLTRWAVRLCARTTPIAGSRRNGTPTATPPHTRSISTESW